MLLVLYALTYVLLPLLLISIFKISVLKAGIIMMILCLIASVNLGLTGVIPGSLINGALSGFKISLIVVSALFFYKTYVKIGFEKKLREELAVSGNREAVIPLLSVVFSGFIENLTGYGIPVTIVAPLLVSLGITPVDALTMVLVGHSWAVPFASLGIPTLVIPELTGLPEEEMFLYTSIYMVIALIFTIAILSLRYRMSIKQTLPAYLAPITMLVLSPILLNYSAMISSILVFMIVIYLSYRERASKVLIPLYPYLTLALILMIGNILGFRGFAQTSLLVIATSLIFHIKYISNVGILLSIGKETLKDSYKSVLAIIVLTMSADMSKGLKMMEELAKALAESFGYYYVPLIPIVGFIGTYVTGSNTASNIIFTLLQYSYAEKLSLNKYLILASQNIGGGLGSMISPAKAVVGSMSLRGKGLEGEAISRSLKIAAPILALTIATGLIAHHLNLI